ncbi:MAG: hypothetical protein S0880_33165 [Actinomycetota bacterium]|nr:hypothetical protein [Actinomycetota bacterium]
MTADLLLVANLVATCVMTGVIWFVQVVHYPLFTEVGTGTYRAYQREHMRRTTWVVGAPMAVEGTTTLALLVTRPDGVPAWAPWAGAVLVAVVYGTTAIVSAPTHGRLTDGFDERAHRRLVATNWVRSIGWSARAVLVAAMTLAALDADPAGVAAT